MDHGFKREAATFTNLPEDLVPLIAKPVIDWRERGGRDRLERTSEENEKVSLPP